MNGVAVLEIGATGEGPLRSSDVREALRARLPFLPILTAALHRPPMGLGPYRWVTDPSFDLGRHVIDVHAPMGSMADVAAFGAEVAARHLDRQRPLWEIHITRPLPDGRQFLLLALHHSITDGAYFLRIVDGLFGPAPEPPSPPGPFTRPGRWQVAREVLHAAASTARARASRPASVDTGPEPVGSSVLAGPVRPGRVVELRSVPTVDIRGIQDRYGVTSNDVYVAMVTTGVRQLLLARGLTPGSPPVTGMVPRNARTAPDAHRPGSNTWSMFLTLPVGEADASARLDLIHREATEAKSHSTSQGVRGFRWDVVATSAGVISGLHAAGRPVGPYYAIAPLQGQNRLAVARTRTPERTLLTFTADRAAFPDLAVLADATVSGLGELVHSVG